jgi:hypothetical protein
MFEELRDTVTKEDFRILRESIDADVSRLDSVLERLAEAQARTEGKVSELAEAQTRSEASITQLVVEVSWTGDVDDIVRADERAKLLRRAGIAAIPLVACTAISPESTAFAKLREVRIWLNGSLTEAAA